MRVQLASAQNMLRLQMQNPMQKTMGQLQNPGLAQVIQQVNTNYSSRRNRDTVELSQKALELLEACDTKKED